MATRVVPVGAKPVNLKSAPGSLLDGETYRCTNNNYSAMLGIFVADPGEGAVGHPWAPGATEYIVPESGMGVWVWTNSGAVTEIVITETGT